MNWPRRRGERGSVTLGGAGGQVSCLWQAGGRHQVGYRCSSVGVLAVECKRYETGRLHCSVTTTDGLAGGREASQTGRQVLLGSSLRR